MYLGYRRAKYSYLSLFLFGQIIPYSALYQEGCVEGWFITSEWFITSNRHAYGEEFIGSSGLFFGINCSNDTVRRINNSYNLFFLFMTIIVQYNRL